MPYFLAICNPCHAKVLRKAKRQKREPTREEYEEGALFETMHDSFTPSTEELIAALTCPRCNSTDCNKTLEGYNVHGYIRGNGYLDKAGCHRDMNLHKLTEDDPYKEYRQAGETDDLKVKIRQAGRHKPNRRHYSVKDMEAAVSKAVHTPDPTPSSSKKKSKKKA